MSSTFAFAHLLCNNEVCYVPLSFYFSHFVNVNSFAQSLYHCHRLYMFCVLYIPRLFDNFNSASIIAFCQLNHMNKYLWHLFQCVCFFLYAPDQFVEFGRMWCLVKNINLFHVFVVLTVFRFFSFTSRVCVYLCVEIRMQLCQFVISYQKTVSNNGNLKNQHKNTRIKSFECSMLIQCTDAVYTNGFLLEGICLLHFSNNSIAQKINNLNLVSFGIASIIVCVRVFVCSFVNWTLHSVYTYILTWW